VFDAALCSFSLRSDTLGDGTTFSWSVSVSLSAPGEVELVARIFFWALGDADILKNFVSF
jgi:hypothetical protein